MNTDGLVRAEDAFVAAGGILRDHNGRWIIGFTRYLGNCVVLDSELWGIKDGLKLTLDWRFERVLIKTDSLEVVNIIQDGDRENSNSALVRRIHSLNLLCQWSIQHVPQKENKIVDNIVKTVSDKRTELRLIEDPIP
ncbi:hypothetical protein Godav_021368, partial [Gossypium davidsonii]|nr:hypothetical protein [Gossypium davidsonii]MBA0673677.1 hypothetical protein [Gossypium klotzschianum]